MRWAVAILLTGMLAGCLSGAPDAQPEAIEPAPQAAVTVPDPVRPWNATYSIAWFPEVPIAGEPVTLRAVLLDGAPPQDPRMTWRLDSATWSGASVTLVLPAGEHRFRLEIAGQGAQVAAAATVSVVSAAEPEPSGALPEPEPPEILVVQTDNEVRLSLEWSVAPAEVRWFLGDDSIRTGDEVTYLYGDTGTYTVIAHALHGTTRYEARAEVTVEEIPLRAAFQFTDDEAAFQMSWGETPSSIQWEFGDGTSSGDIAPVHTYGGPGPWEARLTVSGTGGTEVLPFIVEAPTWPIDIVADIRGPVADFGFTWPWEPTTIQWTLEGQQYADVAPQHTFSNLGVHVVQLTLQDEAHTRTETVEVVIERVPLAIVASVTGARADLAFTWGPEPDQIDWRFGDGTASQEAAPTHTYGARGTFPVSLTVVKDGFTETAATEIEVTAIPLQILAAPRMVNGAASNHIDFSFDWGERSATSIAWDFGDGASQAAQPVHVFRTTGVHTVELTVADAEGSSAVTAELNVDIVHPYLFDCEDGWTPDDRLNHGTDGDLHWAVLKSGFRMVFSWTTSAPEPSTIRMWDGAWTEHTSTLESTEHLVFLEGLPTGRDVCFEVDGKFHATRLANGPTGWDAWDQVYTFNSVNLVNEQSHLETVEIGIDDYATLLWDATDGNIRAGLNFILVNDVQHHNSGWVTCYIVPAGGTPTCNQVHDVLFTFDASPQGAASTYRMGVQDPAAAIWMNWYWQGAAFCGHICLDDVGNVLTHEYGHYLLDMRDYYAATDDPTGTDCWEPSLELSIMGGSRDATEFDGSNHPCPNRAQFADYEPNWELAQAHFGRLPDRADGINPGPDGSGGVYSRVTIDPSQNLA